MRLRLGKQGVSDVKNWFQYTIFILPARKLVQTIQLVSPENIRFPFLLQGNFSRKTSKLVQKIQHAWPRTTIIFEHKYFLSVKF